MSNARKILRNFSVLFGGNVVGQVLFFIAVVYLARVLGPAAYGVWSFAQTWQLYLLRAGEFGLEVVAIRSTSRQPDRTRQWITNVVTLRACMAVVLVAATALVATLDLIPSEARTLVLIFSLAAFPAAFTVEWVYEARQEVALVSAARIVRGVLFLAGIAVFVQGIQDVNLSAWFYVGSILLPTVLVFLLVVNTYGFRFSTFRLQEAREAIRQAVPIGLATLLSNYSLFMGTMTVGYLQSQTELGLFSAAHRIVVMPWAYVVASFHRVLLPSLSKKFHESRDQFTDFVERFFHLAVLVAATIGVVGTLAGPQLIDIVYSDAYGGAKAVFAILLWSSVVGGIRFILEIALIASDRHRSFLNGTLFLAASYSVLVPLLTKNFGIVGAAWGAMVAEVMYVTYLMIVFPHIKTSVFVRHIWKPIVGVFLGFAAGAILTEADPFLRGIAVFSVFITVMISSGAVTKSEIALLTNAVGLRTREERSQ